MNSICGWRLLVAGILALVIAGATGAGDPPSDQPAPPVRLKKKEKPKLKEDEAPDKEPKQLRRTGDPKDDDPAPAPEEDPKEIVARVAKNMRSSEEHLARKDPGEDTRQIQGDIIKDLDALIKQKRCQCQQQSSSSSSSSNSRSSSSSQSRRNAQAKNGQGREKAPGNQTAGAAKPSQGSRPGGKGKGKDGSGVGQTGKGEKGNTADLYKDVWGHLPENLRQQMDAYSKEKFMAKYGDLLKQYYATLAEKSRKKE